MIFNKKLILLLCLGWLWSCQSTTAPAEKVVLDETNKTEKLVSTILLDSVWAGHPVRFSLFTHEGRQYISYYNANRNMVVGQRNLSEPNFEFHIMPATTREEAGGTSTVVGWDSHNSIVMAVDKAGYIHLSGNMHANPITYFRSTEPNDITTLQQHFTLVGPNEERCTYPKFTMTKDDRLLFQYRDGGSGNGNEIYNIFDTETQTWSRLLDSPFTDGQGLMNAYQSSPKVLRDGNYHVYWMWRDTPDCSTNHDLSYMRSPDLLNWYDAFGKPIKLPATIDQRGLIVDGSPPGGGMLNLAARMVLDNQERPVFVYHKYDEAGMMQLFTAKIVDEAWQYAPITEWDYRWEFSGNGSINREVILNDFSKRSDGRYEVDYWHIKYGTGTVLLDKNFAAIGEVKKAPPFVEQIAVEGDFPGLLIQTMGDAGDDQDPNKRYILKWETLNRNRDKPRPKPWPPASKLYLYELAKQS